MQLILFFLFYHDNYYYNTICMIALQRNINLILPNCNIFYGSVGFFVIFIF